MSCLNVATTSLAVRGGDIRWEDVHGTSRVVSGLLGVGAWGKIEWQGGTVCPQWELCARAIVMKPEGIFLPVWAQNWQYFVFAMSAVLLCFSIRMVSLFLPWKKYGKDIFQSFFCPPVVGDLSCSVETYVTGKVTWKQFSLIVTIVTHLFKELGK